MAAYPPSSIAIVGLAGRLPGAPDVQAFWRNLEQGVESLAEFSDEELIESGVPAELFGHPDYVRKGTVLENADLFDAGFFGYNPREAEILDPQQRIFLECAWEALEDAGYAGETRPEAVGVYAGSTTSSYAYSNLLKNPAVLEAAGGYQLMIANDKDYLATRVSYKLNLKGPSMTVQTACSTSLVAVQTACAALLAGQCDMALAGGVSVGFPQKCGYLYAEGMIFSPDGHCRPFDAQGRGIRAGFGAGVVILKRLEEALRDGDCIRAVIRGAATNNDGGVKMGYTTPSAEGQAKAIAEALRLAQVHADSISYIEAHGTATPVGDPIEIAALSRAFRASTNRKQFCAIGSVKSNIGHLDAAAGVAGLIKTVLALEHKRIPPSLNFRDPNPQIDFENSPFFVNSALREWKSSEGPRRAGVSSFGIGGTNAHVVLEEAPPREEPTANWPAQLLVLSARSAAALDAATTQLAGHLAANPSIPLADACYTAQVGRKRFPHRRMLVCSAREEAIRVLSGVEPRKLITAFEEADSRPVVFLFSGQGSQHAGMARALYDTQPLFRSTLDECAAILHAEIHCDLRQLLYSREAKPALLDETHFAQPALFAIEYSLARLWMSWGVQPESMIGHSIGEYVAACLAGVFSLEDGLRLVAARGRLMQSMPRGEMLAVPLSSDELRVEIGGGHQLSLAAVNTPGLCAISGPPAAIAEFRERLAARGVECRTLHTSHAFHSSMMDSVLDPYRERAGKVALSTPKIPFLSNLTGRWILPEDATDASYWTRHLRETVRFAEGIRELAANPARVFLEVGPGHALATFARECLRGVPGSEILGTLPHPKDPQTDAVHILNTAGRLWLSGVPMDWSGLHRGETLHRVPLPTYPFERQSYWVFPESNVAATSAFTPREQPQRKADLNDWFYVPSWRRSVLPAAVVPAESFGPWLVFADGQGPGDSLADALAARGEPVVRVRRGTSFSRVDDRQYTVHPGRAEDYRALLNGIAASGFVPRSILHLWSCGDAVPGKGREAFHSLRLLSQALGDSRYSGPIDCVVVSSGLHAVNGNDVVNPELSLLLGPCKVIPREYPHIRCRSVDLPADDDPLSAIENLMLEPGMPHASRAIAYRGGYRWEQSYEPCALPKRATANVRERGVYLITGGLGGIGLTLAGHLAETAHARLALISRTALPDRAAWPEWIRTHEATDETSRIIGELEKLEALGGEVLPLAADVCDPDAMREAIHQIHDRCGPIHGAIHAAGSIDPSLVQFKTHESAERVLAPKVEGTLILDSLLRDEPLDFLVLCSSISAICSFAAAIDYSSANCFLDAFAASRFKSGRAIVVALNWDNWRDVGMAVKRKSPNESASWRRDYDAFAITPAEGIEAFRRVVASGLPQVAVITRDLHRLLEEAEKAFASPDTADAPRIPPSPKTAAARHARLNLATAYAPPETDTQRQMAAIWTELLGMSDIGIDDNFFELGGHSLLATGVLTRVRNKFGASVPLRAMFDAPTIRMLSEHVETLLWAAWPAAAADASEEREEIEL